MSDFETNLNAVLSRVKDLMIERHAKYGEGNISRHGMVGIVVRLGDKMARLEQGLEDHDDETLLSTLDDIAGYGLIGLMWELGLWPGNDTANLPDNDQECSTVPNECGHNLSLKSMCGWCEARHICTWCGHVGPCHPKGEGLDLAPEFTGLGQ